VASRRKNSLKDKQLANFKEQEALYRSIDSSYRENISFSFKFFNKEDPAGQSLKDWEKEEILADLLDKLKDFSGKSKQQLLADQNLEIYDCFPCKDKTEFSFPFDIPKDSLRWARL
jgi:hypothetical protein